MTICKLWKNECLGILGLLMSSASWRGVRATNYFVTSAIVCKVRVCAFLSNFSRRTPFPRYGSISLQLLEFSVQHWRSLRQKHIFYPSWLKFPTTSRCSFHSGRENLTYLSKQEAKLLQHWILVYHMALFEEPFASWRNRGSIRLVIFTVGGIIRVSMNFNAFSRCTWYAICACAAAAILRLIISPRCETLAKKSVQFGLIYL